MIYIMSQSINFRIELGWSRLEVMERCLGISPEWQSHVHTAMSWTHGPFEWGKLQHSLLIGKTNAVRVRVRVRYMPCIYFAFSVS